MELELLTIYTLSADGQSYSIFYDSSNPIRLVSYSYSAQRMGTTTLTATLMHDVCLDTHWTGREFVVLNESGLTGNDTVLSLEKFFLLHKPGSAKTSDDQRYEHTLEFQSERDITLNSVYFCDSVYGSADKFQSNNFNVTFFGTLTEFVSRYNSVLTRMGLNTRFSVLIDAGVSATDVKEVSFEKQTLFEALVTAFDVYKVPFYFAGDVIHFGEGSTIAPQVNFEYGYDKSLLNVKKINSGNKIVTRCTGQGSDENIPYYYPNPTPKGTLKIGTATTAAGVSITNQKKFADKVALDGYVEYLGKSASNTGAGISYVVDASTTSIAGVTVYASTRGFPFMLYNNFSFNGGYRGVVSTYFSFEGGSEQSAVSTVFYRRSDGVEMPSPTTKVAQKGFNFYIERVYARYVSGDNVIEVNVPYDEIATGNVSEKVQNTFGYGGFPPRIVKGIAVDLQKAYPVMEEAGINVTSGSVSIRIVGKIACSVNWLTAGTAAARFTSNILSVEGYWSSGGWRSGDTYSESLSTFGLSQIGKPVLGSKIYQAVDKYVNTSKYLLPKIYRDTDGAVRFLNASDTQYVAGTNSTGNAVYRGHYQIPGSSPAAYYQFANQYSALSPKEHIEDFSDVKVTLSNSQNAVLAGVGFDTGYNIEDTDSEGNLKYKRFFLKIGNLGFNLFDCAIENGDMTINVKSGNCAGCKFKILVDENTHKNLVQVKQDGSLDIDQATGMVKEGEPQTQQNDTTSGYVWLKVSQDADTFGGTEVQDGVMPNWNNITETGIRPSSGDAFVLTNILMPDSYYTYAEELLEQKIVDFMYKNNSDIYSYAVSFSRIYLADNPTVRAALNEHSSIILKYNGVILPALHVSQFTLKQSEGKALPDISVELTDTIGSTGGGLSEKIAAAVGSVVNLGTGGQQIEEGKYLRRDIDETMPNKLFFEKGIYIGNGSVVVNDNGDTVADVDYLNVRKKATFTEVEIDKITSVGGRMILSLASMKCSGVELVTNGYKCLFNAESNNNGNKSNGFAVGDLAICSSFGTDSQRYYWRKVTAVGADFIVLSKVSGEYDAGSDEPQAGDDIVQLGNVSDTGRQSAQVLSCYGNNTPSFTMYSGINSFSLVDKEQISMNVESTTVEGVTTYRPNITVYGDAYIGNRDKSSYMEWDSEEQKLKIKGTLSVSTSGDSFPTPCWRDAWVSGRTYYKGDEVSHNGSSWLYVSDTPSASSEPSDSNQDWRKYASKGAQGDPGSQGDNGRNTTVIHLYKRADSATIDWQNTLTYTFATDALSSIPSGWSRSIPDNSDGKPLFVTAATASGTGATDDIAYTEWSTPVKYAEDGADGSTGPAGPIARGVIDLSGTDISHRLPEEHTFLSGDVAHGEQYVDICMKYNSGESRYNYYRCISTHTADYFKSEKWELANQFSFVATDLLLAQNAYIRMLSARGIYLFGDDSSENAEVAGIQGSTGVNFWAGANRLGINSAPFRVYNNGRLISSAGNIAGFEISGTKLTNSDNLSGIIINGNTGVTGERFVKINEASNLPVLSVRDNQNTGVKIQEYGSGHTALEITANTDAKAVDSAGSVDFKLRTGESARLGYSNGSSFSYENIVSCSSIKHMVFLTQAQYNALATKDSETLYLING